MSGRGERGGRGRGRGGERGGRGGHQAEHHGGERGGRGRGVHQQQQQQPPSQQRPPSQQQYQQRPPSQPLSKITTIEMEKVGIPQSVQKSDYIVQGNPGKAGKPVKLISNFVPIKCPHGPFAQYSVKFSPEVDGRYLANFLLRQHAETIFKGMAYVFDGNQMLFCERALNEDKKTIEIVSKRDEKVYKIMIVFAASISSSNVNQGLRQLFNLIFRRSMYHLNLQQFGRNHYNMALAKDIPKYNVKVVPGYLTTLSITPIGILMNIDVIYRMLRTDSVLDLIRQYQQNYGSQRFKDEVENAVVGSIILCSYNNKTVQIHGIDWGKDPSFEFLKSGKKISLHRYYKEHHNKVIKDFKQPLLLHCRKTKPNEEPKEEYFLPELCQLTGITDDMRKDRFAMKEIKECISMNPMSRCSDIGKFANDISTNKGMSEELNKWESGFKVIPQLLELPGRILEKPKVFFKQRPEIVDDSGGWQIRSNPLHETVAIEEWIVVEVPGLSEDIDNFIKVLRQVSKPLGITFGQMHNFCPIRASADEYKKTIREAVKKHPKSKFALVCLPNDGKLLYDEVKKVTVCEMNIPSQCITRKTFQDSKGIHSKATKVAVQIQSKIGGIPWVTDVKFPGPTMICGVDVFHSGEKVTRKKNSIVGFTASMTANIGGYYSDFKAQKPGQEIIDGIQTCFADAIKQFIKKNNTPPKYILFYRDGVGEGQLQEVFEKEVKALQKCLHALKLEDTKLCFIVVLKRIHERIFAGSPDSPINPTPGTICDTGIVSKDALEFLLVPHHVNQGSATPTKFQCILNDPNFGPDYIQSLTYKLCHMYFNWFGAIRVPAPCMFAHKIAFLVGQSFDKSAVTQLQNLLWYL